MFLFYKNVAMCIMCYESNTILRRTILNNSTKDKNTAIIRENVRHYMKTQKYEKQECVLRAFALETKIFKWQQWGSIVLLNLD